MPKPTNKEYEQAAIILQQDKQLNALKVAVAQMQFKIDNLEVSLQQAYESNQILIAQVNAKTE